MTAKRTLRLPSWSYSTHQTIEACPAKAKYAKLDRLPDPSGWAAERGQQIHDALERYVLGEGPYPRAFSAWRPQLDAWISEADGVGEDLIPELEVALGPKWQLRPICPGGHRRCGHPKCKAAWDGAKARGKLDLIRVVDAETIYVLDYKTGRQYDYHAAQLECYAAFAFHLYPWVETVEVEAWYLDRPPERIDGTFTRSDGLPEKWQAIMARDLARRSWPAQRNALCKWCAFNSKKGGPCVEGA